MADQVLPPSLLREGQIMLQAVLDDLACIADIEILLPLDTRCDGIRPPQRAQIVSVHGAEDILPLLRNLLLECDVFWPIAPETAGILAALANLSTDLSKRLLLSCAETVALCADKWATYQCLIEHNVPIVKTLRLPDLKDAPFAECVVKPIDGVGCEGNRIFTEPEAFRRISDQLHAADRYIVQPYLRGKAVSLSCLCKQGKAWLLTYNEQLIGIEDNSFKLQGCRVNAANPEPNRYEKLIKAIAQAMPELWGYIGIDLIETLDAGPMVLEINPRITTSYAGIRAATGINVAEQMLTMLTGDPVLQFSRSQAVQISIQ